MLEESYEDEYNFGESEEDTDFDDEIETETENENEENYEVSLDFSNGEELKNGVPRYGGDNGRIKSVSSVIGWDEYVDGSNGVSRIMHNGERVKETVNSNNPVTLSEEQEELENVKKKIDIGKLKPTSLGTGLNFKDMEGMNLEPRVKAGSLRLEQIPIDRIALAGERTNQIRTELNSYDLQDSIGALGMLTPLHVVPFGNPIGYEKDEDGNDLECWPIYKRYILLHGRRRYDACINLNYQDVLCLVDSTIPTPLIQTYQAIVHQVKPYKFSEKLTYLYLLREQQPSMPVNLIESALGFHTGDLPKAEYIDQMKVDYPDPYKQVEFDKMSIDQAFKKIEKEIAKKEKEELEGDISADDVDDELRGKGVNELDQLAIDIHKQEVGNRTILDAVTRRTVEARDNGECQCCGFGHGESDFMGIFNVHHMVAVQYGGSDSKANLILLCQNCHKLVHDYEMGRFNPEQSTFERLDQVKKIVVIGNILRQQRIKAITTIRQKDAAVGRQLDKGVTSIGKALKKLGIDLKGEQDYLNGSPYDEFINATKKLAVGGVLEGSLSLFEVMDEDALLSEPETALNSEDVEDDILLDELIGH